MLPMMSDAELDELARDIEENGLQQPIILFRDNSEAVNGHTGPFPTYLLDGRNRLAALGRLGITDPREAKSGHIVDSRVRILEAVQEGFTLSGGKSSRTTWTPAVNPTTFVLSANVRRRHLSTAQKRDAIAAYLEAEPTASDRKIARELGVDNKTVANVRGDRNEEIPQTDRSPVERAKAVLRDDPSLSQRAVAAKAEVGQATANKARKELVQAGELPAEKTAPQPKPPAPKPAPKKKPSVAEEAAAREAARRSALVNEIATLVNELGRAVKTLGTHTLTESQSTIIKTQAAVMRDITTDLRLLGAHIIKSIRSRNWTLAGAIEELVDNSLGHGKAQLVQIIISNSTGIGVFDDGIGIDDVNRIFRLGDASSHDKLDEIGQYGIGSKDATIWLGDQVLVRTVHNGRAHQMRVDWSEVERTGLWPLRYKGVGTTPKENAWGTEIHITKPAQHSYKLQTSQKLAQELGYVFGPGIRKGAKINVLHVLKNGDEQWLEVETFNPPDLTNEIAISGEIETFRGTLKWTGRAGLSPSLTERHNGVSITFGHRVIEMTREPFGMASAPTLYCEVDLDSSTAWKHALSDHKDKVVHFRDKLMESINAEIAGLLEQSRQETQNLKLAMFTAPIEMAMTNVLKGAGVLHSDPDEEPHEGGGFGDGAGGGDSDDDTGDKGDKAHNPTDEGDPAKEQPKPTGIKITWEDPGRLAGAWNWEILGKTMVLKLDRGIFGETVDYPPKVRDKAVVQLLTSFLAHAIDMEFFSNEKGLVGVITPKLRKQLADWAEEDGARIAPRLNRVFLEVPAA